VANIKELQNPAILPAILPFIKSLIFIFPLIEIETPIAIRIDEAVEI
jgi:hypothetical protein